MASPYKIAIFLFSLLVGMFLLIYIWSVPYFEYRGQSIVKLLKGDPTREITRFEIYRKDRLLKKLSPESMKYLTRVFRNSEYQGFAVASLPNDAFANISLGLPGTSEINIGFNGFDSMTLGVFIESHLDTEYFVVKLTPPLPSELQDLIQSVRINSN